MKGAIVGSMLLSLAVASSAFAECTYPRDKPMTSGGEVLYEFIDSCGQKYEVGYWLENSTLHFPNGGTHSLPNLIETEAELVLRQTYGLVGQRDNLIRTSFQ